MQLIIQRKNKCEIVQVIRDAEYLFVACSLIHSFIHSVCELLVCETQWVKTIALLLNRNADPLLASELCKAGFAISLCQPQFSIRNRNTSVPARL